MQFEIQFLERLSIWELVPLKFLVVVQTCTSLRVGISWEAFSVMTPCQ